jgi:plasmid stabilization system protein ParE
LAAFDLEEIGDYMAQDNYVIFFESTTEQVTIVRIWHGARDVPEVLNPL